MIRVVSLVLQIQADLDLLTKQRKDWTSLRLPEQSLGKIASRTILILSMKGRLLELIVLSTAHLFIDLHCVLILILAA